MRSILVLGWLIWSLCASSPALAGYSESKTWFEKLTEDQKYQVQISLTLQGYYNAFVDGLFGSSTFRALQSYQRSQGQEQSGELSPTATTTLLDVGYRLFTELGFEQHRDDSSQAEFLLPGKLLTESAATLRGTRYISADNGIVLETIRKPLAEETFSSLYANLTDPSLNRAVKYSDFSADRFVVSGTDGERSFYLLFAREDAYSNGFSISWTSEAASQGAPVATLIASYFIPVSLLAVEPKEEPSTAGIEEDGQRIGAFLLPSNRPEVIVLTADIVYGTALEFTRSLRARPDAEIIELASDGGLVDEALQIAYQIHDRRLDTRVPVKKGCYSACSFIFFAGNDRAALGELGVHQLSQEGGDLERGQAKVSDILEALTAFGVDPMVPVIMFRTRPGEMYVFSTQELSTLKINRVADERLPSSDPAAQPPKAEEAIPVVNPANIAGSQSLLLEAADDGTANAVPFSGTLEWTRGTDEKGLPTLIGRANIPARNMGVEFLVRKNSDPTLPASHLMEINFTVSETFSGGSIASVPGVLLKNEELIQGSPLIGASARVVGNSFLFALSASPEDVATNRVLMTQRRWIDIALIYETGKRAVITLELTELAAAPLRHIFSSAPLPTPTKGAAAKWEFRAPKRAGSECVVSMSTSGLDLSIYWKEGGLPRAVIKPNRGLDTHRIQTTWRVDGVDVGQLAGVFDEAVDGYRVAYLNPSMVQKLQFGRSASVGLTNDTWVTFSLGQGRGELGSLIVCQAPKAGVAPVGSDPLSDIIGNTPDVVVADNQRPAGTPTVIATTEQNEPLTPAGPSFGEVSDFVRGYQGTSACFAAVPVEMADGSIAVTTYGDDANASAVLADTVAARFGDEVAIDALTVAPYQCGVLAFLSDTGGPSGQLHLALVNKAITNGNFLQGTIRNTKRNFVHLLIVDDQGMVSAADQFLDQSSDVLTFEAQVLLTGSGTRSNQLLVAIVSTSPLEAPSALDGRQADEFFQKLGQEAAILELMGGDKPDVAITSFVVVE